MLKNYKTVIWDWNGTLFEDAEFCRGITDRIFQRREIPLVDPETHERLFCHPIKQYYENLGIDFSRHSYEDIAAEFVQEYEANAHTLSLRAGAREMLEFVRGEGIRQLILSAAPIEYISKTVERLSLTDFFDTVIGQDNHYGKGKLETARVWAESHDLAPDSTVLIGDTDHDYEVAREIGVDCILIPSGYQHRDNLTSCGVSVISCLRELY